MAKPLLSLIVPMKNESANLDTLIERLQGVMQSLEVEWEMLCIDDGSSDDTAERLRALHEQEPRIKLIRLSRNFGKEAALSAGLDYAEGDAVVPIDADLQDPPELIAEMLEKWREGHKVVIATRRNRSDDSLPKRITARLFYWIIHRVSRTNIPENTGDFRLLDAQVVQALRRMPERSRFMKGMFAWVGFSTAQVFYDRPGRVAGQSNFSFFKLWRLAMDGIFSFTTLPLQVWTYIGILISSISFAYAVYLIGRTLMYGSDMPGYPSLMVAILFMGGIQLISLGVIGEYVGRIYRETKQRPLYVVAEALGAAQQGREE